MLKVSRGWAENHRRFVTNSSTGCQKLLSRCTGNKLSRKSFRWKPYIFLFRHWAENFHFVRKFFDWVVRTAFHLAIGLFREEVSSLSFRLSFSDIEPKFFGILWIVFQLGCQNCILRVQKDSLSWISFAKVVEFCLSLSDFQTKKIAFWQKNIAMFVKSAFWLSIGKYWGEVFLETFFGRF